MKFPLGEMTLGDILDRGMKLLFARLPVFYVINLLVLSPLIAFQLALPFLFESADIRDESLLIAFVVAGLVLLLLVMVLQPIGTAAMLHIVMEEYAGRRASLGAAFRFALTRFIPLFFASLLLGLLLFVGMLACCIPGCFVIAVYSLVTQVVVLERAGVGEAFSRSADLTRGYRWRVFGVIILLTVANSMVQGVVGQVLGVVLPPQQIIPQNNGFKVETNHVNYVVNVIVTQLVAILFATYVAVCTTLLYLDLRIRKEGFDLELAAQLGEEPGTDRPRRRRRDDDYDDDDDRPRRRRRRDDFDDEADEYDDRPPPRRRDADDDDDDRPPPRRRRPADDEDDDWDYDNDRPKRRPPGGLR